MLGFDIPTISELITFVTDSIVNNDIAQGGFVFGLLALFPRFVVPKLISLYRRIERLVVYHVNIEESDDLFMYFEMWLSDNYRSKYRNVEAALRRNARQDWQNMDIITRELIDDLDENVIYKQYDDVFYIRRGLSYLRVFKGREKLENASNIKNLHHNRFVISGIFAKRIINNLITEAHEAAKAKMVVARQKTIRVKTSNEYGEWIDENVIEPKKMENIILEGKNHFLNDIDNFLTKRSWYANREIAYKRGYLLHGVAGTGKTTLTLSLAKRLNRTIHFLQTSRTDDKSLRNAFREIPPKSIMVIEDIDAAFNQREDGSDDIKFSFSTLLNCLDGVFSTEDIIVIFTTNHIEKLDPALIRSGRIDYKMEFEMPTVDYVNYYLQNFYDSPNMLDVGKDYKENLAMVDVQDACLRYTDSSDDAISFILELSKSKVV